MPSDARSSNRVVHILVGLEHIGKAFGAGMKSARAWEKDGAPIVRDDRGTPRAEIGELWDWMRTRYGSRASAPSANVSTPAQA